MFADHRAYFAMRCLLFVVASPSRRAEYAATSKPAAHISSASRATRETGESAKSSPATPAKTAVAANAEETTDPGVGKTPAKDKKGTTPP